MRGAGRAASPMPQLRPGAAGVELGREHPVAQAVGQVAATGRDDQPGAWRAVAGMQVVVAEGQVGREGAVGVHLGAVLEREPAGRREALGRAGPHDPHRRDRRAARLAPGRPPWRRGARRPSRAPCACQWP